MELKKNYDPTNIEDKWYDKWMKKGYFHSEPDEREAFTMVIPPPNVTGVLHMGHMLNNTIQDVLVRTARMKGKNACWLPGTDHASIATESKVVNKLKELGIKKSDISRKEFLEYAWDWKEEHGGIILEQLKKLGASCDWERTKFTMDEDLSESVIDTFIDLHKKGLIYRGIRMVNWDPQAITAVSDEEVIHKEVNSKLYYVKYNIAGTNDFLTIATTRPETILGDTAVCVNPKDERYKHLKGKEIIIPLVNRKVPLIYDEYVDMEFGTGALKITPAHDIHDYEIGIKHKLQTINIFNDNGTLNDNAQLFVGIDRFKARKLATAKLEENGNLLKVEDYKNKLGYSERTNAVIEPKLSIQWFVKMDKLAKPALENVMNDSIKFHPAKFKNMYKHWMENVKDWCISRQLWWGHQIPAFYIKNEDKTLGGDDYIIAKSKDEALEIAKEKTGNNNLTINDIRQDEDVLDTWFSSWLWPISTFDGIRNPENKDIKYYYPTNDLVTAPEIIFFWVARMIMAGYEYLGQPPFKNVYFTGIVRDQQRRKMSKSLGNSPSPLKLIKKYGADGVRIGMLLSSPAGNDLLFDEGLCEQGRNFNNKIWNAFRLTQSWTVDESKQQPEHSKLATKYFDSKLNKSISIIEDHYSKYRISDVLMTIYKLFWDDYSSWYLEIIKPPFGEKIDKKTFDEAVQFFEKLLQLLHPFVPFITEELWHHIKKRNENNDIIISKYPESKDFDEELLAKFKHATQVITAIRDFRNNNNIPNKEKIELKIQLKDKSNTEFDGVVKKLCLIETIEYIDDKPDNIQSLVVHSTEYFIPFSDSINIDEEIEKINKDIEYQKGFLNIVMKKLNNDKFVQNAPEKVVEIEKKKKADAEKKIEVLKKKRSSLN